MCGIWSYITYSQTNLSNSIQKYINNSDTVGCRGPDKKISIYRDNYTFIFSNV